MSRNEVNNSTPTKTIYQDVQLAGAKQSEQPEAYGEMRKREILEFALLPTYQKRLNSNVRCLSEETYNRSIRKITEVEPEILLKIKDLEKTCNNAKAIKELQEKLGVCTKSGSGNGNSNGNDNGNGNSNGNDKHKHKDRTTQKGNGPKDKNGYYFCGNCGKTHKGVYHKSIPGTTTKQNGGIISQLWMTKKATRNYIKTMITSETKKKKN